MKDIDLQAERAAFEAWFEPYWNGPQSDLAAWSGWKARAAVEADRAQRVPEDIVNYVRGIYAFLESVAPADLAEEAFRLPPSATRNQEALFDSLPDHTPRGLQSSSGQVGGGERESQAAIGLSAMLASTPAPAQQEPAKPMDAHRAAYFMRRFLHEEKMLGPNEQAALHFTIAALEAMESAAQHQEQPQQERKPMTDPCPGCTKGHVCRTPKCGRLALPVDHPLRCPTPGIRE